MGSSKLTAAGRALARLALAVCACMLAASLVPVVFGWRSYVVLSGSMAPSLRVGDVVVAAPATVPPPGRIAVFTDPQRPGRTIVHRVDRSLPDGSLITKGDANAAADSTPVPASAVRGEARLRLPLVGLPAYWWQTRAWLPAAGTAAVLLALLMFGYPAEPGPRRGLHRAGRRWTRWGGVRYGRPVPSSRW